MYVLKNNIYIYIYIYIYVAGYTHREGMGPGSPAPAPQKQKPGNHATRKKSRSGTKGLEGLGFRVEGLGCRV